MHTGRDDDEKNDEKNELIIGTELRLLVLN